MRFLRILVVAVLFVLAVTLVLQNQDVFTYRFSLSLDLQIVRVGPYLVANVVLIAFAFIAGVVFSVLWGALYALGTSLELRKRKAQVRALESELAELRLKVGEGAAEGSGPTASAEGEQTTGTAAPNPFLPPGGGEPGKE